MEEELKKAKKKRDPMKSQIIRNLFDIEDKPSEPLEKTKSVIIIKRGTKWKLKQTVNAISL